MSLTRSFSITKQITRFKTSKFFLFVSVKRNNICEYKSLVWFNRRQGLTDVGSLKILMGKPEVMPAISIFLLAALKSEVNHL